MREYHTLDKRDRDRVERSHLVEHRKLKRVSTEVDATSVWLGELQKGSALESTQSCRRPGETGEIRGIGWNFVTGAVRFVSPFQFM